MKSIWRISKTWLRQRMANGRNPKKKGQDSGRDPGGFVAIPWSVLDCPAYTRLSHPAKALLLEVARQYVRDNNGSLLLTRDYMATRGWKSADTLTNAKRALLDANLIHETVMGHRPNKASWYAITWQKLDKIKGYDVGATECFKQGSYRQNGPLKNASLIPPAGPKGRLIVPPAGTGKPRTVPPAGTIKAVLPPLSVPPAGHHLDMPSPGIRNTTRVQARETTMGRMLRCVHPKNRPLSYYAARTTPHKPDSLKA